MDLILGVSTIVIGAAMIAILASRSQSIGLALWTGYLGRAALAFINLYFSALPGADKDAAGFQRVAYAMARDGAQYIPSQFSIGSQMYPWLLATMYRVTATSPLLAAEINAFFGALVIWNVWRVVQLLVSDETWAVRAAWLTAIFPTLLLFSALTLREVAVVYPFSFGLYHYVLWTRNGSPLRFATALGFFCISAAFHAGMIGVLAAVGLMVGIRWIHAVTRISADSWLRASLSALPFSIAAAVMLVTGIGIAKLQPVAQLGFEAVAAQEVRTADDRAAYLKSVQIRSPIDVSWQLPLRIVYFLFAPFPWMATQASDLVGVLDGLLYLGLLTVMLRGRHQLFRDPENRALVLMLACGVVLFAVGTSNYGTAIRHRAKLLPLIVVLSAVAADSLAERRSLAASQFASPAPA
jgi:hypothetical protein